MKYAVLGSSLLVNPQLCLHMNIFKENEIPFAGSQRTSNSRYVYTLHSQVSEKRTKRGRRVLVNCACSAQSTRSTVGSPHSAAQSPSSDHSSSSLPAHSFPLICTPQKEENIVVSQSRVGNKHTHTTRNNLSHKSWPDTGSYVFFFLNDVIKHHEEQ